MPQGCPSRPQLPHLQNGWAVVRIKEGWLLPDNAPQTADIINHCLGDPQWPLLLSQLFPSPQSQSSHWEDFERGREVEAGAQLDTDAPQLLGVTAGCREGQRLGVSQGRVGRDAQRRGLWHYVYRLKEHSW